MARALSQYYLDIFYLLQKNFEVKAKKKRFFIMIFNAICFVVNAIGAIMSHFKTVDSSDPSAKR